MSKYKPFDQVKITNDSFNRTLFLGETYVLEELALDYENTWYAHSLTRDARHILWEQDFELLEPVSPEGGIKHDDHKPDLSLISYELMEAVAKVRMFGAKKYSRDNWKKGFKVTRSCAAALRHIFLFLSGETEDSESHLPHLAHAICCLEHALYDMKHHPANDDRSTSS